MNKKLIKTLASITCGLGMALTIPSFVSSCGNSTFDTDPEKLKIEYQGNYLLWGSTQFDITEDHVVSADYDGTNLKDGFKISYESNNENLILNFEKIIGEGYKFKVDNNTPSGDYEFRIGVTYGDETIYSRVFYLGVRDFVPLSNFSVSNNGELSINLQNDYSKYDGIYVPDKLNDIVVKSIKFQNSSKHLTSIKTLAFDCESEVTTLDHYNYFDNLEVVELPKKLQAVNSYSLCCSKFNEEHNLKAPDFIIFIEDGSEIWVRDEHCKKVSFAIMVIEGGIEIWVKDLQFLKALLFNIITEEGIDICFNEEQSSNALLLIIFTDDGIDICCNFWHLLNKPLLIEFTKDGIVISVNDPHLLNAKLPIEVTEEGIEICFKK